jgi:propionyl-CoA synthetase
MIAIRRNIAQQSHRLIACRAKPAVATKTFSSFPTRHDTVGRFGKYSEDYEESLSKKEGYWHKAASDLHWFQPPTLENTLQTHPKSPYMHKWFVDGVINTSYNCLDRHVLEGRGNQKALIYDSPVTNTQKHYTYAELLEEVSQFAAALSALGVTVGDRVVIYMPNIPEAVIAMLACARIGAIHSVVFGGFAAKELATRIDHCKPKVILTASGGVLPGGKTVPYKPLVEGALEIAKCGDDVKKCVVVQREGVIECTLNDKRDVSYKDLMKSMANEKKDAVPLPSTHEHWILYTSGTTGMPKGVLSDIGGYAVALKWSMSKFYDNKPGDVFFAASDIGWAVGHSYSVYGPLLHGCTSILFEGKPVHPDAGVLWRVIEEHGVNTLFLAPTGFRAIRQMDPDGSMTKKYDLSTLKSVFVAGERSDPNTLNWIEDILSDYSVPAIDHWWQTELKFPGAGNAKG